MQPDKKENLFGEAMLRQAFIEYHRRELAKIPPEDELSKQYAFSPSHVARMKALLRQADRRIIFHKVIRAARRTAAVIAIAIAVLFSLLLFNPDVRAAVRNVFVEWHESFARFTFSDFQAAGDSVIWQPINIPEGFSEAYYDFSNESTEIEYRDSDSGRIIFRCAPSASVVYSMDNEHAAYSVEYSDGVEYHLFDAASDEYFSGIIWESNGYAFKIISTLNTDELMKIALSVEPKK